MLHPAPIRRPVRVFAALVAVAALGPLSGCNDLQRGLATLDGSAANAEQRGAVEIEVKTNHAAIMADAAAGGGPALTQVFDVARVPDRDRPYRISVLNDNAAFYAANPGGLTEALMVWGARE